MLKLLRDKGIQKNIYIGLAVIVTISFVISGIIVGGDDKKATSALAKLDKRKISVSDYLSSYKAVQRQAGFMYGDKLNELRGLINFKGEAWDRLLLLDHAKKENIRIADKEVVDWITKQEGFKQDGKFSDAFYKMYVERALRSTPRQFEEEIRHMLTLGKVQDKIQEGINVTDEELKKLYQAENTEKDLVYAILPKEQFEAQVEVKDESIKQLYDMVKDKLTEPAKDGQPERPLTLEESKEQVIKLYREQEAASLALKRLNELKAKIASPADFEAVLKAEKLELTPYEKYKKGMYPAGIYPADTLEKAVSGLSVDGISDAFLVPKGAMIVKVTKVITADDKKFEEAKKAFKERITAERSQEELKKLLEKLRDKLSINLELMKEIFPADSADSAQPAAGS